MAVKVSVQVEGVQETMACLHQFGRKIRNNGIRAAMRAGIIVPTKAVKAGAKKVGLRPKGKGPKKRLAPRTGLLAKSIGSRVRTYRDGDITVGIVGPRGGMATQYQGRPYNPAKTGHLVDRGTKARGRKGQKGKSFAPGARAQPFLEPAMAGTRGAFKATFAQNLQKQVTKATQAAKK